MATIDKVKMIHRLKKIKNKRPRRKFIIIPLLILLSINIILALEFDNVKTYYPANEMVKITNNFGYGKDLAEIKLNTPRVYNVFRGKNRLIAELDITLNEEFDYKELFETIKFYDIKKNNQEINRNFVYRIKEVYYIEEKQYKSVCIGKDPLTEVCSNEYTGTKQIEKVRWIDIDKKTKLKSGVITIGIFTDVYPNDVIEWIPKMLGKEISEFAVWNETLTNGLFTYWKFDEGAGTNLTDSAGTNHGEFIGTENWTTGKNLGTMNLDGSSYWKLGRDKPDMSGGARTFSLWIKTTSSTGTQEFIGNGLSGSWNFQVNHASNFIGFYDGKVLGDFYVKATKPSNFSDGKYHHLVMVLVSAGNNHLYWDGVDLSLSKNLDIGNVNLGARNVSLGATTNADETRLQWFIGQLDEFGIWNRTLSASEIAFLYDNGVGTFLTQAQVYALNISQNSPINYFNQTNNNTIKFNCSYGGSRGLLNLSLVINNVLNYTLTNTTSSENLSFDILRGLPDGNYTWYCMGHDGVNQSNTTNRYFNVDTSNPQLNIIYPLNTTYFTNITKSNNLTIYINWSLIDPLIDRCFYFNGTSNVSVSCYANQTSFIDAWGSKNYIFYANDTTGRINITNIFTTFLYKVKENNRIWSNNSLEGSTENFILNIELQSGLSLTYANLIYNNVSYPATYNNTGENYTITRSLITPEVTTTINYSFYYELLLSDGTYLLTSLSNQSVSSLTIDNCSSNTINIMNITFKDEANQNILVGASDNTTIEVDLDIKTSDGLTTIASYSTLFNKVNPINICIKGNLTGSLGLYGSIRYSSDTRIAEYYNIQNSSLRLDTIPLLIDVYGLLNTSSTEFLITYKDKNYIPVEGALILIKREYLSEGVFKVVEIPITDISGQAVGHFDTNNVRYSIVIMKDGKVLASYSNIVVICDNKLTLQCYINLNPYNSENTFNNFEIIDNLAYTLKFTKNNRSIALEYITTDGATRTINLTIKKFDRLGNITICSYQDLANSGVYTCSIPDNYGNTSIIATLYNNGEIQLRNIYYLPVNINDIYGEDYILYEIILIVSIVMMALSSTIGILIALILGIIASALLFLYPVSSWIGATSSIVWLIIALGIVIFKLTKRARE